MKLKGVARSRSYIRILLLLLVLTTACTSLTPQAPSEPAIEPLDDWLEIYFTDPESPNASDFENGPDWALAAAIDAARLSVDVAIYSFNLWSIRDALLDANARGVVVRVVAESENLDGREFQALIDAGIPVLGDRREGLMHNKFVIIDRTEVWTGSMNFTLSSAYKDRNNLLLLRSSEIAEDYQVEFNEMFQEDLFGTDDLALTPNPVVQIGDSVVEIYFSPDDNVQNRLLELLESAEESIYFLAYSFTADPLGEAIRSRAAAGVTVAGVLENDQVSSNSGTEYDPFQQAGLDVRLDTDDSTMHNKIIIIDEHIVVTGSYNFSSNAEEINDENVVIIFNREAAAVFLEEFWRIFTQALQPQDISEG